MKYYITFSINWNYIYGIHLPTKTQGSLSKRRKSFRAGGGRRILGSSVVWTQQGICTYKLTAVFLVFTRPIEAQDRPPISMEKEVRHAALGTGRREAISFQECL